MRNFTEFIHFSRRKPSAKTGSGKASASTGRSVYRGQENKTDYNDWPRVSMGRKTKKYMFYDRNNYKYKCEE